MTVSSVSVVSSVTEVVSEDISSEISADTSEVSGSSSVSVTTAAVSVTASALSGIITIFNGEVTTYYKNGKEKWHGKYVNGKREGYFTLQHPCGEEENAHRLVGDHESSLHPRLRFLPCRMRWLI